jgi:hypothetical protein
MKIPYVSRKRTLRLLRRARKISRRTQKELEERLALTESEKADLKGTLIGARAENQLYQAELDRAKKRIKELEKPLREDRAALYAAEQLVISTLTGRTDPRIIDYLTSRGIISDKSLISILEAKDEQIRELEEQGNMDISRQINPLLDLISRKSDRSYFILGKIGGEYKITTSCKSFRKNFSSYAAEIIRLAKSLEERGKNKIRGRLSKDSRVIILKPKGHDRGDLMGYIYPGASFASWISRH